MQDDTGGVEIATLVSLGLKKDYFSYQLGSYGFFCLLGE